MSITRRLFLRNTAALPLGAATLPTITAEAEPARLALEPLVYAEDRVDMWAMDHPKPSPRKRASAARSPIMVLFERWNAARDHSDKPGISDDEVSRRCDETDEVMSQLLLLPPTDAADLAAKLMCFTHYGNYALEECAGGDGLMQEMAAMVGQMDRLVDKFQPAHGGSPCA